MTAVARPDRAADLALCCALAVLLGIAGTLMRAPRASRRRVRVARRRSTDPEPADLARVDRQIRINVSSARRYHHDLRPMLRDLATTLAEGSLAQEATFAPLFADTPAPDDPRLRGPTIDELERIVETVERLAAS